MGGPTTNAAASADTGRTERTASNTQRGIAMTDQEFIRKIAELRDEIARQQEVAA